MINYHKFSSKNWQGNKMAVKGSTAMILILFFILLSFNYAAASNELKTPVVTATFQMPGRFSKSFPITFFVNITLNIFNPNNVTIQLRFVELKYYLNETFLNREGFAEEENIPPNERKALTVAAMIDFSSISEQIEALREGKNIGKLNIKGTAYFLTPSGKLIAPIEKEEVKYPTTGPTLPSYPSKITIEIEDEKWNRVEGANVTLISKENTFSGVTDSAGKVEFEVPSTKYTLKIFKEGFLPYEETLDLSTPSNVGKIIQIYHAIKLKLEVVDEKGNPIRDANVTFSSKDVGNFTKTTNDSGIAEFEIPRTNYTLSVIKKGYLPYKEVLDLSKSPIESKVIQLKPELTWLEQYWFYLIIGVIMLCIIIVPIVLRLKRRF
jgi:LEA14-like dessication related protein